MAKIKVTTTTGSVYKIDTDTGVWIKNNYEVHSTLSALKSGVWDGDHSNIPDVWTWPEVEKPVVGESMYIHGRGMHDWWLSTPVVSVEEIDYGL